MSFFDFFIISLMANAVVGIIGAVAVTLIHYVPRLIQRYR